MSRIAIAQISASTGKAENLKLAAELIAEARDKSARAIAFPEFAMAYSPSTQSAEELTGLAETLDGNFTTKIKASARQHAIDVLITVYETCPVPNRVYDTALWIDSQGDIRAVYRKLHLYDALGFRESDKFLAGSSIEKPFQFEAAKIGLMICYDIRFPEVSRILSVLGAELLVIPSAWVHGIMKEEHWQTLIKARAIENGIYVIAPDQIGNIYTGRSMVVNPFGTVLLDMGNKEGMEVVELEKSDIIKVREKLPLLKNRRTDVYQKNLFAFVSQ
jgi:deaminated glutathione amidase